MNTPSLAAIHAQIDREFSTDERNRALAWAATDHGQAAMADLGRDLYADIARPAEIVPHNHERKSA